MNGVRVLKGSLALAGMVGCGVAGYKLWGKHPIAGAAIGVLFVSPGIAAVIDYMIPETESAK